MNPELNEAIQQAAAASSGKERRNLTSKARRFVRVKKKTGRHSEFSEEKAAKILSAISNGGTLTEVAKELDITPECVYHWMSQFPSFSDSYYAARESMARTLVDQLLDSAKAATSDEALLLKVRASVIQWVVSRYNQKEFSDSRRIELKAEIHQRVSHELAPEQKQRIAESWMLSQQKALPVIEGETIPALEIETDLEKAALAGDRVVPKKRKAAVVKKAREDEDF